MSRTIDQCTCGHERLAHNSGKEGTTCDTDGCACPHFFPHPQPNTVTQDQPDLRQQVLSFLILYGSVVQVSDSLSLVQLPSGETWRFDITKVS